MRMLSLIAIAFLIQGAAFADQANVTIGNGRYKVTVVKVDDTHCTIQVNGVTVFDRIGKYSAQQLTTAIRSIGGQLVNPKVRE